MLPDNQLSSCIEIWCTKNAVLLAHPTERMLSEQQRQSLYSHYTGQGCQTAPSAKHWTTLLEQSFIAHMPLLTPTSAFRLRRRCYSYKTKISDDVSQWNSGCQ